MEALALMEQSMEKPDKQTVNLLGEEGTLKFETVINFVTGDKHTEEGCRNEVFHFGGRRWNGIGRQGHSSVEKRWFWTRSQQAIRLWAHPQVVFRKKRMMTT